MRKQLIMEKALELFAKQGFEATSVQQITDYCGISKGAFYLSFKSKNELILAIIDNFMEEIVSEIDHVVKKGKIERLLHTFYLTMLQLSEKHSDFSKIFIQEQTLSLQHDLLNKMKYYDHLLDQNILFMIERLYGEQSTSIKYDLVYCVKSFIDTYSRLFLLHNTSLTLDLEQLAASLVEKTDLLAKYITIPFITKEIFQVTNQQTDKQITATELIELIDEKINTFNDSIEKESLVLIRDHILKETLSPAILSGLIENIHKHSHCKWLSYLLRNYFNV